MGHKLIRGDAFIEAMQATGLLPEHCVSVEIQARYGEPIQLNYETYGDERLVEFGKAQKEADGDAEAVCR